MMDDKRLAAEKRVLESKLPISSFRFMDMDTDNPFLVMAAKTNGGNVYTIRIDLINFPNSKPEAFVRKMLYTKSGKPMSGPSADMHTLSSKYGFTQICHYADSAWTEWVSLYKVYIKCRLWLEMYDLHLKTGKKMDYYLNHQH